MRQSTAKKKTTAKNRAINSLSGHGNKKEQQKTKAKSAVTGLIHQPHGNAGHRAQHLA